MMTLTHFIKRESKIHVSSHQDHTCQGCVFYGTWFSPVVAMSGKLKKQIRLFQFDLGETPLIAFGI